jgi:hypothetical protein
MLGDAVVPRCNLCDMPRNSRGRKRVCGLWRLFRSLALDLFAGVGISVRASRTVPVSHMVSLSRIAPLFDLTCPYSHSASFDLFHKVFQSQERSTESTRFSLATRRVTSPIPASTDLGHPLASGVSVPVQAEVSLVRPQAERSIHSSRHQRPEIQEQEYPASQQELPATHNFVLPPRRSRRTTRRPERLGFAT